MKENEEREQNNDITPNGEVSPIKPTDKSLESECQAEEPDSTGADSGALDEKDPSGGEAAQGALGQVKAKVEVCKDESVGKCWKLSVLGLAYICKQCKPDLQARRPSPCFATLEKAQAERSTGKDILKL